MLRGKGLPLLALLVVLSAGCSAPQPTVTWTPPATSGDLAAFTMKVALPNGVHPTGLTTDGERILFGYPTASDSGTAPSGLGILPLNSGTLQVSTNEQDWKALQLVAVPGAVFSLMVRDEPSDRCSDAGIGCVDWQVTRAVGTQTVMLDSSRVPVSQRDTPRLTAAGDHVCWPRSDDGHAGGPTQIIAATIQGGAKQIGGTSGWLQQCISDGTYVLVHRRILTSIDGQPAGISNGYTWGAATGLTLVWPGAERSTVYGASFAWVRPLDPLASTREVEYGRLPRLSQSTALPVGGDIYGVGWIDDRRLAVLSEYGLSVFDTSTGKSIQVATEIAPGSGIATGYGILAFADVDGATLDVYHFPHP